MNENWKDIRNFEGLYQVSSLGRYKSCDRYVIHKNKWGGTNEVFYPGKIMKWSLNNKGYCIAHLSKNNKKTTMLLHRLVAEAFVPNPDNLPEVNHEDENKLNNCASNLQWCTRKYNNNYGKLNKEGRRISRKHIMKKVVQYDLDGNIIAIYEGLRIAKEITGINNVTIARCCEGQQKTSGGYIWKYYNEEEEL